MYSYIIVRTYYISTLYFVMGIDYYNNSSAGIQQQYVQGIVHRAFYLLHFRRYYCGNTGYYYLLISHELIASMQSVVTGQTPITSILPPPFNMHGKLCGPSWMKHTSAARRSDMLPPYVCLFLTREEGACTTDHWAFGSSDTVMMNICRVVYRENAYILLGRRIDAKDTCISKTSLST